MVSEMLEVYEQNWLHEHGLDEIAWVSQEIGLYD
jgi:hypothetical protein